MAQDARIEERHLSARASDVSSEDRFQLVRWNDFKLRVRAIARAFVAAPLPELRHVTESRALHMFVRDLDYQFWPERFPR